MRIFTFGCSLTQYFYPTWADIIIHDYKQKYDIEFGQNWGRSGCGNQFIMSQITECDTIHNFTPDDVVLVQWTSMFRDDRYHEGFGWSLKGSYGSHTLDDKPFVLNSFLYQGGGYQWADFTNATMRDCAIITATTAFLEQKGVKYITTGFRDFDEQFIDQDTVFREEKITAHSIRAILEIYGDRIKPTVRPILNALEFGTSDEFFASRPKTRPSPDQKYDHMELPETHPLPGEHLKFVEDFVYPKLDESSCSDGTKQWLQKYIDVCVGPMFYLEDTNWFNKERTGWSDDRWRP